MNNLCSKDIMNKYNKITSNFEELYTILKNDSNVIDIKRSNVKNVLVLKVVFKVYDGLKPCTFFSDGGFHLISGQSGYWFKSPSRESKIIFRSAKMFIDSYNNSETPFEPHYHKDIEMKCGKDVKFFGRLSQTFNLIANEIIQNRLYEKDFKEWGDLLNIDTKSRKSHKSFTNKDWFYHIQKKGTSRGITVISIRSYEGRYKKMLKAVRKMYCAKLNKDNSSFNKQLEFYREEMTNTNLLYRLFNPQIRNKGNLSYKIFNEVGMGNFCTDYTARTSNNELYSKRQSLLKKLNLIKNTIYNSERNDLKSVLFTCFKDINKMSNDKIEDKLNFFENVINKHTELKTLFKLIKSKYNISLASNSMCSFSKPFLKRDKKGKLIHYSSYEKYQNKMNYLRMNEKIA